MRFPAPNRAPGTPSGGGTVEAPRPQGLPDENDNQSAPGEGGPPLPPNAAATSTPNAEGMTQAANDAAAQLETGRNSDAGDSSTSSAAAQTDVKGGANAVKDAKRRELILNGPIAKGVLAIALPSVATMLLQTTNSMLDRAFVGRLGPEALAAITVASSLLFALMAAAMAVSVGTTALVARFIGEGRPDQAQIAARQSFLFALVSSLAVGLPMFLLRGPLLGALGLQAEARALADSYLAITCIFLPTLFVMLIFNGIFRGLGDTTRPFWVTLGAILVHIFFGYGLIFGQFGLPEMGLPGGAVALTLSQIMAIIIYAIFLRRSVLGGVLSLGAHWRPEWDWAQRIAKIGLPASFQQLLRVGSMLAFQKLLTLGGGGDAAVAALGVGLVSESISFMPGFGYSIAASAFVGQNLGARHVRRANSGAWAATWQAVAVMSVMGVVFYFFAEPFAHAFVRHAPGETPIKAAQVNQTIEYAVAYLQIAAISQPFLALAMVLTGALQGAGETNGPTAITVVSMILIRLPLACLFLFALHLGTVGAWWAMSLSTVAQGIFTVFLFRRGRWRHVRV